MTLRQRFSGAMRAYPDHHRKEDTFWHTWAALLASGCAVVVLHIGEAVHVFTPTMAVFIATMVAAVFGVVTFTKIAGLMVKQTQVTETIHTDVAAVAHEANAAIQARREQGKEHDAEPAP